MFRALFVIAVVLITVQWYAAENISGDRAIRAAENIGLTDVRVEDQGVAWGPLSGCSQDDNVKFRVSGTDQRGERRWVEVCGTWPIGGYTVRA